MSDLQVMWKTPKHVFVRRGNLVVQVRGEPLTIEALQAHETGLRLMRAQIRGGTTFGALLVIEPDAPAPTGEVAKKQRELVGSFTEDERIHVCIVFEGTGTTVALKRTLARALFRGARRHIAGTVREGARWLSPAIGIPAEEIVDFVESQRPK